MEILAVDDDDIALELIAAELADTGHPVHTAKSGEEALRVLEDRRPRLVVTDWNMPGMDGVALCRTIREQVHDGYVYVILLTGRSSKRDIVDGLGAGADDFVVKPFDPDELRARVLIAERILSLETRHVAIFALAKLAESRDPETGQHLERIRIYSRMIAERLASDPAFGIDAEFVENIYLTSPLHDIGKVGIPDAVLLKPGKFTADDFEVMKTHARIGAETLAAAAEEYPGIEYLQMAMQIALTHHERWDGTGYPNGLAGEEIPLSGRIVALADVYDALTSKRVYKPAFNHRSARDLIVDARGTHFDPRIVDTFLELEERFLDVANTYREVDAPDVS